MKKFIVKGLISFLGDVYAGQSSGAWIKNATKTVMNGGPYGTVLQDCWNAANAILGPGADKTDVGRLANTIIQNLPK